MIEATATREFRLAPMDPLNTVLTVVVGAIPVLIMAPALLMLAHGQGAPPVYFVAGLLGLFDLLIVGLLVGIAVYARPRSFRLSPEGLRVVWPVRERLIPLRDIAGVELVGRAEFRARYGTGMRIGAGGFLGGFGWLSTSSKQTFDFYISRVDRFVLVHVHAGKSWMITPETPDEFVRAAQALLGQRR